MPLDVARRGTLDYKDPPLRTIVAANDVYQAGYHNGNPGGLDAIDTDLATANIKNGVTIFGKVGSADVHDISDATAVEAEVLDPETFYAVGGGIRTGTMPTQTLNPANENVLAGYYAATTLSTVDVQLAAANILSGVNIFGFVGVATVQDIADANALVGQVLNPATFYSVTGARKTGTMATVALAPGANAYPAGYHVGAANLTAVDGDLVTGSIRQGVTIFGVAGHNDVRNISDADLVEAEAPTGKFFYAVSGGRRTGTGTKTLNPANETVAAGYYAATTLSAVDVDLAVGNIKSGITIFGFLGTLSAAGTNTFDRYYSANINVGATYTPADAGLFVQQSDAAQRCIAQFLIVASGSNWYAKRAEVRTSWQTTIGDGTNLRFRNGSGAVAELLLMRWYNDLATYEKATDQDIASLATYTPAYSGFLDWCSEVANYQALYQFATAGWRQMMDAGGLNHSSLSIGDGTNWQIKNTHGTTAFACAIMRATPP